MTIQLLFPENLRTKIAKRYENQHRQWLTGTGKWPLVWKLGSPTEAYAKQHEHHVFTWMQAWESWHGAGDLIWCEKHWHSLGKQRLPEKLLLTNADEAVAWLGETTRWETAESRYRHLSRRWPALASCLPRHFEKLADYDTADIERLEKLLEWITIHPQSNLYPRQLPIAGMDSKWLERRKELLTDLVAALQNDSSTSMDFYTRCGLKQLPNLMRLRILDPVLRACVGGLADITAPIHTIASLKMHAKTVYIVENLQTGLAFDDLPESIVILGLGYHVDILAALPWLAKATCYYWGDIDTHGFAILNRARSYLPHLRSVLMDEATLHQHQPLWGTEDKQHAAMELPRLTLAEQALYKGLKEQRWGKNVRLEQEKIDWTWSWKHLYTLLN